MTTTQFTHPVTSTRPGSLRAQTSAAAAVIALATAIAGSALLAGIATGSAVETPAEPVSFQIANTDFPREGTSYR